MVFGAILIAQVLLAVLLLVAIVRSEMRSARVDDEIRERGGRR